VVKKDNGVGMLERWCNETPHSLITAKPMGEQHELLSLVRDFDIVSLQD
jgi:hypothetical protein